MEEAFKKQALDMDNIIHQNRELGDCLVELEKLWLAEEQFTMELHGRVEALQDQVCKCGLSGSREVSGPLFTLSSTAPKVESAGEQINPETNHNHNSFEWLLLPVGVPAAQWG